MKIKIEEFDEIQCTVNQSMGDDKVGRRLIDAFEMMRFDDDKEF